MAPRGRGRGARGVRARCGVPVCRGREPRDPPHSALPGVPQSVSDTYGFAKKVNLTLHVLVSHTSPGGRRKRSAGTGVCGVAGGSAFAGVWVRPLHQSCPLTASGFLHVSRVALRHECRQRGSFVESDDAKPEPRGQCPHAGRSGRRKVTAGPCLPGLPLQEAVRACGSSTALQKWFKS